MERQEATAVVVAMAQDRGEDTKEGEALRIILRELRDHRKAADVVEAALARMNGGIDALGI